MFYQICYSMFYFLQAYTFTVSVENSRLIVTVCSNNISAEVPMKQRACYLLSTICFTKISICFIVLFWHFGITILCYNIGRLSFIPRIYCWVLMIGQLYNFKLPVSYHQVLWCFPCSAVVVGIYLFGNASAEISVVNTDN